MILICFPRVTILDWYRELITAGLTPARAVIPSLFRLVLAAQLSPSLVIMADKESRIFEEVIDQKLNSIANIPSAISDFIFGDNFNPVASDILTSAQPRSQVPAQPGRGAGLLPPPVSGRAGGGHHHGRRGLCRPRVSLHHQV